MKAQQITNTLLTLDERIKNARLVYGTYRNEPNSLAQLLNVHYNTIFNWSKSGWWNMKVSSLIELLAILEAIENVKRQSTDSKN